jgi:hypothetical protein
VAGTLAGLAGVTVLELHCANLQVPHVMLWHTAVMPVSAAAGALLVGWAFQFVGPRIRAEGARILSEFFKDWRFLFVGLRWWFAKMANKV